MKICINCDSTENNGIRKCRNCGGDRFRQPTKEEQKQHKEFQARMQRIVKELTA